jgi:hypothetical protein
MSTTLSTKVECKLCDITKDFYSEQEKIEIERQTMLEKITQEAHEKAVIESKKCIMSLTWIEKYNLFFNRIYNELYSKVPVVQNLYQIDYIKFLLDLTQFFLNYSFLSILN